MQGSEELIEATVALMRYKLNDKELLEFRKILCNLVRLVRVEAIGQVAQDFNKADNIR